MRLRLSSVKPPDCFMKASSSFVTSGLGAGTIPSRGLLMKLAGGVESSTSDVDA